MTCPVLSLVMLHRTIWTVPTNTPRLSDAECSHVGLHATPQHQAERTRPLTGLAVPFRPPVRMLGIRLSKQPVKVETPCEHRHAAIGRPGPLLLRKVPVQLDTVVVGGSQVEGFADTVVTGTVQSDPCGDQTT